MDENSFTPVNNVRLSMGRFSQNSGFKAYTNFIQNPVKGLVLYVKRHRDGRNDVMSI
jgi:hypothetical protein